MSYCVYYQNNVVNNCVRIVGRFSYACTNWADIYHYSCCLSIFRFFNNKVSVGTASDGNLEDKAHLEIKPYILK